MLVNIFLPVASPPPSHLFAPQNLHIRTKGQHILPIYFHILFNLPVTLTGGVPRCRQNDYLQFEVNNRAKWRCVTPDDTNDDGQTSTQGKEKNAYVNNVCVCVCGIRKALLYDMEPERFSRFFFDFVIFCGKYNKRQVSPSIFSSLCRIRLR